MNGSDFTVGHLRVGYQSHLLSEPGLTQDEAIKAVILSRLDGVLLASVAEAKGIATTAEDAQALVAQTRATCETDETTKAECTSVLSSMGFEYDAYWKSAVSVYQDQQTILKATTTLRDEYVSENDTDAKGEDLEWLAVHKAGKMPTSSGTTRGLRRCLTKPSQIG